MNTPSESTKLIGAHEQAAYNHGCVDEREYVSDAGYRKAAEKSAAARAALAMFIGELEAKLAAAEKDAARLDWFFGIETRQLSADLLDTATPDWDADEWRAAIDTAMEKSNG